MNALLDELRTRLAQVKDLNAAAAVLEWDQETYMPDGGAGARAAQTATLRRLAHERFTDPRVGELLASLRTLSADEDAADAALLRVAVHDYERAVRLPADLVAEFAEATGLARQAWRRAYEQNRFAEFAPHLERLVALSIRKAEAFGYPERRYDALLDEFEPGLRTSEVERVFSALRAELVPIVQAVVAAPSPDTAVLHRAYPEQAQWDFGMRVLQDIGYDLTRGRLDRSTHPFTTSFSINDVRLTTRFDAAHFSTAFFGTLHEAGHGLYEQGIDPALDRTLLADGTSLGMHESQSRLWENLVGRSLPFWQHYFPVLVQHFPETLAGVTVDQFYRAANRVQTSAIRVEADEVTYNLHIMLRFELENELIDGRLKVADLPERWNEQMEAVLGIRPDSDTRGVLQDIHWSLGIFGYFPTYALGNLMSVQLYEAARRDIPDLEAQIRDGRFNSLLEWLRLNIHRHGRSLSAGEILRRTTGSDLDAAPWLRYIRRKYGAIYEIAL